jgi:tRNA 5-methylaminomethyl-2-thiouridine biosynthesis bifunctional protein
VNIKSALAGRHIAVIGAGIAGASVAHALAQRGYRVTVVEAATAPAAGASGNLAGVFRPLPSLNDSHLSRLLRAGFLLGRQQFAALPNVRCGWTGVLHVARDAKHEAAQRRIVAEQVLSPDFCRFVERDEASALAGWPVELGGWWFPQAGWINPPSLIRALLSGIDCRFNFKVEKLERIGDRWRVIGERDTLEADDVDVVVLANGIDAPSLVPDLKLPIRVGRGLVSHVPETATPPFDIVATRLGYVTPAVDGLRCAGATMDSGDRDPAPRLADHIENLYRLDMVLPGFGKHLDPARLDGRVSFRPMSPDRLPIVGPLSANEGLWIIDGFGARGLVFASICAELLASQIGDEPLPLEADLVAAVAPGRFAKQCRM